MLIGLLLLVSSAFLVLPAVIGVNTLMTATSLVSASSLFAAFVLLVSSASIATFLQLAVLSLTRRRSPRSAPPMAPRSSASPAARSAPLPSSDSSAVLPAQLPPLSLSSSAVLPAPVPLLSSVFPAAPALSPAMSGPRRRSLRLVPFLLAALALLPGCAQAPAAQAAAPAACGSAVPDQVVATVALQGGKASPAPHRVSVPLGSQVRLGVSVDAAAQIHVHGYDLEYPVQPGQPTCIVFVASQAGLFDVEAHPDTLLLQLEVK
ncbi:hypothetical protein L3i22_079130 [Actinoplanes sp. L3-i22]|nr:hypothetical protein L3i22_079130 [Actinoplanes sp. L3-i22]